MEWLVRISLPAVSRVAIKGLLLQVLKIQIKVKSKFLLPLQLIRIVDIRLLTFHMLSKSCCRNPTDRVATP